MANEYNICNMYCILFIICSNKFELKSYINVIEKIIKNNNFFSPISITFKNKIPTAIPKMELEFQFQYNWCQVWSIPTCMILARWQSAASSSPCFSAHTSMRPSRLFQRWPHWRMHSPDRSSSTSVLNSHMLMKWKSCENSWIVSAALTRHRRSSDMADDNTCSTSPVSTCKWITDRVNGSYNDNTWHTVYTCRWIGDMFSESAYAWLYQHVDKYMT